MSTRWYPLYQKGNPQLRVFLPNFWLKLVNTEKRQPKNVVTFHCSMEMTKFDIINYLSKIYNVHPIDVKTRIKPGAFRRGRNIEKLDDVKVAYVVLDKEQEFTFPNVLKAYRASEIARKEKLEGVVTQMGSEDTPEKALGQVTWFDSEFCVTNASLEKKMMDEQKSIKET